MKTGEPTSETSGRVGENDRHGREPSTAETDTDRKIDSSTSQPHQIPTLEGSTPRCTRRLRRRRRRSSMSVSWGVAHVFHIEALSDFSHQQIQKTWWQAGDYAQMFNENAKLLDEWMKYGRLIESSDSTFRGLEQMTQEEVQRRKRLRDQAVDAVLDEQDRQYEEENLVIPNPEGVARVYAPMSQTASRIAHRRGLQDEEDTHCTRKSTKLRTRCDRSVHFCPMVHVQTGLHLSDYTQSEVKKSWFSEAEVKAFKAHSKEVIKALLKCMIVVPIPTDAAPMGKSTRERAKIVSKQGHSRSCCRGLEPYLLSNKIGTRQQNVRKIWDVVFKEQDRQDSIQSCLPAHLAQISRDASYPCYQVAQKLAQQDERFVKKYLSEEVHEYSILSLSQPPSPQPGQRNRQSSHSSHTSCNYQHNCLSGVAKSPSGLQSSTSIPVADIVESSGPDEQTPTERQEANTVSMKCATFDQCKLATASSGAAGSHLLVLETPSLPYEDNDYSTLHESTEMGVDKFNDIDIEKVTATTLPSSPVGSLSSSSPSSVESDAAYVFERLKALSLSHSMKKEDQSCSHMNKS